MKEIYEVEVKVRLKKLDAQIQEMVERADQASADAQTEYNERLDTLKTQRSELQDQFAELQDASADAWNELRNGFDKALTDFTDAANEARVQFQEEETRQAA